MEVTVRPYTERDREEVRGICESSSAHRVRTEQRRLYLRKMQCDYYLDCEPEHCFVASDGEKLVGCILCAVDCEQFARRYMDRYYPKIKEYSKLQAFLARGEVLHYGEHANFFPAHFRLFVLPDCRRQGVGTALTERLRAHLCDLHIKGMIAFAPRKSVSSVSFAEKCGFSRLRDKGEVIPWWKIVNCTICKNFTRRSCGICP